MADTRAMAVRIRNYSFIVGNTTRSLNYHNIASEVVSSIGPNIKKRKQSCYLERTAKSLAQLGS